MSAFIFCKHCRSERVDVRETTAGGDQVFACATCGQTATVAGFTLGRCGYGMEGVTALPRLLDEARRDVPGWERRPRVVAVGRLGPEFERRGVAGRIVRDVDEAAKALARGDAKVVALRIGSTTEGGAA